MQHESRGNTAMIRRQNKRSVLSCLRRTKSASVQELALKTGLSYVTVSNLIRELSKSGEILPGEMVPSAGGRPSQTYRFHRGFRYAAILYGHTLDGRDSLHLRVTDLAGTPVYGEDCFPDRVTPESLSALLSHAFERYPAIAAIGLGLPGEEQDGIVTINDYPELIGTRLTTQLSETFGVPALFENDVNAAVLGFQQIGPRPPACCTVGIYFPGKYIPGAGILLNGEIYRGKNHFAGELGSLPFGIDWLRAKNETELLQDVARLAAIICCLLAPETILLYGDSLPDGADRAVSDLVHSLLHGKFHPKITLSRQFEAHFERGMIRCTLDRIEEDLLG